MPKSRWRRRLLWLGLFVLIGGACLNGPGFRWGGALALRKVLRARGIEGEFELRGTLLTGPRLRSFHWRAPGDSEVKGREVSLGYAPWKYFTGGVPAVVQSLSLQEITATIDLRNPPEKEEEAEVVDETDGGGAFPWKKLPQPAIDVSAINLTLLLPDDREVVLENLNLALKRGAGEEKGVISWDQLALPSGHRFEGVAGTLEYGSSGVALEDFSLGPALQCQRLAVAVSEERRLEVETRLALYGGTIEAAATVGETAELRLVEGGVDLAEALAEWVPEPGLAVKGKLQKLRLTAGGMDLPWDRWAVTGSLTFDDVAYDTVDLEQVALQLEQTQEAIALRAQVALDSENNLGWQLSSRPVGPDVVLTEHPWDTQLEVNAPSLRAWLEAEELPGLLGKMTGRLRASGEGTRLGQLDGSLRAESLVSGAWVVPDLTLAAKTVTTPGDPLSHVISLTDSDALWQGEWKVDSELKQYRGQLKVDCPSMARLQPEAGEAEQLRGAVVLAWEGEGRIDEVDHRGSLSLQGNNVCPAAVDWLYETDLQLDYEGANVTLKTLDWAQGDLKMHAEGALSPSLIEVPEFTLHRGEECWVRGRLAVPLATEVETLDERFWLAEAPVDLEIRSIPVPLEELMRLAGQARPVEGTVELTAIAKGLAGSSLEGDLRLIGRQVGVVSDPPSAPTQGDLDLQLHVSDGALDVDGSIAYAGLEPWTLEASVPFQMKVPGALAEAPVTGRFRIPSTKLDSLASQVTALEELRGQLAAEIVVSGILSRPEVSGEVAFDAAMIRFQGPDLPRLENSKIRVQSTLNEVTIEEVSTWFEGGQVSLAGRIDFASEEEEEGDGPLFDLRAVARQALLKRDENMVARANAEIGLRGPWERATVSGTVSLVESRFFKEIELIPTNRPVSSLPSSPVTVPESISIGVKPFDDWTVDVRIRTEEAFRVRTNLVSADIGMDVRIHGPGSELRPLGAVDFNDAYARLPFSRLDLKNSEIRFTEECGCTGQLDIRGESQVRDCLARVVVQGSLNEFDYVLTSNPPLPEEEIMTLLATGTTREELVGSSQAAASRAALLLFDKFWRKVSQKDWEDPETMREKRLTFETGHVNPRTGSTMTTARLRLTDHWSLTGDADIEGEFRGLLHYVFKF